MLDADGHLELKPNVVDSPKDREAALAAGVGRFVWASEFFDG